MRGLVPPGGTLVAMTGYSTDKQALLDRLRRIEGQVRGVHRMVEEDTYCIDVLTQIAAATRALQAVAVGLLEGHLAHCVVDAMTVRRRPIVASPPSTIPTTPPDETSTWPLETNSSIVSVSPFSSSSIKQAYAPSPTI